MQISEITPGVLLLPLVGRLDQERGRTTTTACLERIRRDGGQVFIVDISGVGEIDTETSTHLVRLAKAIQLMGCRCVYSGLSPAVAKALVEFGADFRSIATTSSLAEAVAIANNPPGDPRT